MSLFRNGTWKGTLGGAALVGLLALAWNVYHTMTSEHRATHQTDLTLSRDDAAWRALVSRHIEETEPLKEDYVRTRQQVMLNAQAISVMQTGMASMQDDLRAIRDYIYGRRPGEQRRP